MIVGERKPMEELLGMIEDFERILVLGCKGCVTVCCAGGPKEVKTLSTLIRMDRKQKGRKVITIEASTELQCEPESIRPILEKMANQYDVVLSMACGAGVQTVAKLFPDKLVLPALNTNFTGIAEEHGVWTEACLACGDCVLGRTAGICPVTLCAKGLLNGPCGGASEGKCEVSKDQPCAWQEIYHALKRLNRLHYLKQKPQVKDWPVHPGRVVREDLREVETT
ncbi:MAG: methylenetetrahydrofolate reductase C-terminal domain-containing protein [Proteobacteria bacterium]|nr:hypothetical protein [Desulfobacteraceae bacterium]MBU2522290.1 methylenetetrahydrofolate reductase C-terminal domain-containing protein [Pseudomonadota bacterium]MBU4101472.1 methylenetetrahydrofolate reductase C-terminal domain-containing protein [Pseudomonadota bacterium]MBU4209234.1 methylenetetrahydrofolate reductase C-terminal domain-containing protein [Pseudomonadota bacterium]MBU4389234.1 methylenetetrahydrofolate reductase C-terminal domain-containing protein [Pseudomonadota bacteri